MEGLNARDDVRVAALRTSHRFGESIGALAKTIRIGDAEGALDVLRAGDEHVEWIDTDSPAEPLRQVLVPQALRVREAAVLGDAARALAILDEHRLLCAHRQGPYGASHWNRQVQRWLSDETGQPPSLEWYAGRPLLVTANDYGLRIYNGDTGVVVAGPDGLRAVIAGASGLLDFATSRLAEIETMHAMTIHKSQGSQAGEVTVLMPPQDSRLLTRELFYTAVTRAKVKVRVVGSEDEVRAALERRAIRASGLRLRLQAAGREMVNMVEKRSPSEIAAKPYRAARRVRGLPRSDVLPGGGGAGHRHRRRAARDRGDRSRGAAGLCRGVGRSSARFSYRARSWPRAAGFCSVPCWASS